MGVYSPNQAIKPGSQDSQRKNHSIIHVHVYICGTCVISDTSTCMIAPQQLDCCYCICVVVSLNAKSPVVHVALLLHVPLFPGLAVSKPLLLLQEIWGILQTNVMLRVHIARI